MDRNDLVDQLETVYDLIVIGGGATGLGSALDGASRGYRVLLLEEGDFARGTSSRSTKLIHGGVRYLKQGRLSLVINALRERELLLQNAPHVVSSRPFVIPCYRWWERLFYGFGLKIYDLLAFSSEFNRSEHLSRETVLKSLPTLNPVNLYGGIRYFDGQFDDARLAVNLMQTLFEQGGTAINYMKVSELLKKKGRICGVVAHDLESDRIHRIYSKGVINATGVFSDAVRQLDNHKLPRMIQPSQGVHIVLDRSFQPSENALMIPKTEDGRVLFVIPWHNRVIVGTTDTPVDKTLTEPRALDTEISYLLTHAGRYMTHPPRRSDIKSVFTGLRPLVRKNGGGETRSISRDHALVLEPSGLVTITGGKWTTYRKMAQETIDQAADTAGLEKRPCTTSSLKIHGHTSRTADDPIYRFYGSDEPEVRKLGKHIENGDRPLHPELYCRPCDVIWGVRNEMARTVEDLLGRRTRSLFLNAGAARKIAPDVAALMARELGKDRNWQEKQIADFQSVSAAYLASTTN